MTVERRKLPGFVRTVIGRFKQLSVPYHPEVRVYQLIRFVYAKSTQNNIAARSAAMAFYLMLALPSLLLCIFKGTAAVPFLKHNLDHEILYLIDFLSPDDKTSQNLRGILDDILHYSGRSTFSISILLTFFFASNSVMVMAKAFNNSVERVINTTLRKKNVFVLRMRALWVTFLLLLVLWASVSLLIVEKAFFRNLFFQWEMAATGLSVVYHSLQLLSLVVLLLLSTGIIYHRLPVFFRLKTTLSVGAVFVTIVYLSILYGFSYWVNHYVSYNNIFGSLGTLVIALFLVQCFAYTLLLGFEVNLGIWVLSGKK